MIRKHLPVVAALVAIVWLPAFVRAETAAEAFANGESLVAKGDFDGALTAYAAAVRGDRANQEYVQHYALLRRVIQLRNSLDKEKDAARWENLARPLHSFYTSQKVYSEALALGKQIHTKLNSPWSAVTLAETQLALSQNDEAVKTLDGLAAGKRTATTQALLGIALVRAGQSDRGKEVGKEIALSENADAQTTYAAARLYAALGESQKAIETLAGCLASVPPGLQEGYREHARTSPEFAKLASTLAFVKALKTESKVPESKCSGGSSCAGCPMRGKCPSSQGQ
jgi:tetratricopeptide (TPR) repeat protein